MEFLKYSQKGDYHWRMYLDPNTKYRRHADRVKEWIKETNVLDIGAGDGKITSMIGAIGVDDDKEGVRLAQEKGVNVILGDAYHLPFYENQFDAVFMGDVLEHMEFPLRCVKEVARVCKGYFYCVTPIKGMQNDPFHYNEFTPQELKYLVETVGFKLEGEILEVPRDKRLYAKFKKIQSQSPEDRPY